MHRQRSWTADIDNPDFWNPKLRAPICFNPAAVRSFLPQTIKRTEWVLAGRSKAQMFDDLKAALDKKELPKPEVGAMCYMMSKEGYLNDSVGHWHPHLMFFLPPADPKSWGANLPGSPILGQGDDQSQLTVFMIPVGHWSDGTAAPLTNEQECTPCQNLQSLQCTPIRARPTVTVSEGVTPRISLVEQDDPSVFISGPRETCRSARSSDHLKMPDRSSAYPLPVGPSSSCSASLASTAITLRLTCSGAFR